MLRGQVGVKPLGHRTPPHRQLRAPVHPASPAFSPCMLPLHAPLAGSVPWAHGAFLWENKNPIKKLTISGSAWEALLLGSAIKNGVRRKEREGRVPRALWHQPLISHRRLQRPARGP